MAGPVENMVTVSNASSFAGTLQLVSPVDSHAPASLALSSTFGAESTGETQAKSTTDSTTSSGQSPRLVDLLMPGTDLSVPPEEYSSFVTQHEAFYQPTGLTPPAPADDAGDDNNDDDEQLVRHVHLPKPV